MNKLTYSLVLSLGACSGGGLDVGSDADNLNAVSSGGSGGTGSEPADAPIPDWSTVGACPTTGVPQPAFVGTWEGAIEDFNLQPIVKLRLAVSAATTDGVCGTLTWAYDRTPPLPLTDPDQSGEAYGIGGGPGTILQDGTAYRLVAGAARDTTLHVSIDAYEAWQGYCEMQEDLHFDTGRNAWSCIEPFSVMHVDQGSDTCTLSTSHGSADYPIKQCAACAFSICSCNATACAANTGPTHDYDLALSAGSNGPVLSSGPLSANQAIHLERVP